MNISELNDWLLSKDKDPLIMGILNVTPDSFTDGGKFLDSNTAVNHAMDMIADGADIIDIGGESTRPFSDPVSEREELSRVISVIKKLREKTDTVISIDTTKSSVADNACNIGADIVNDIIVKNKKKFNDKQITFKRMDLTKEKIPKADLFICRDFLFHLSYEDIYMFLKNLKKSNSKYLLISSHYKNEKIENINKDIHSGDFRKIDIFQPPFNFSNNYLTVIDDYCDNAKKYLYLFKRKDFVKFFDSMNS